MSLNSTGSVSSGGSGGGMNGNGVLGAVAPAGPTSPSASSAANSVYSDFCQAWISRFPGSDLPAAWEEDVRANLKKHKSKVAQPRPLNPTLPAFFRRNSSRVRILQKLQLRLLCRRWLNRRSRMRA